MAAGAIVGIMGAIIAIEGLMAVLEAVEGDPEADVKQALEDLVSRNQRRAFSLEAGAVAGEAEVERKFSRFNEIPRRALTQAAIGQGGSIGVRAGVPQNTAILDFVSARLGRNPSELLTASAPRRVGDLSGMMRSIGKGPIGE